jgi:hypothetical protein
MKWILLVERGRAVVATRLVRSLVGDHRGLPAESRQGFSNRFRPGVSIKERWCAASIYSLAGPSLAFSEPRTHSQRDVRNGNKSEYPEKNHRHLPTLISAQERAA